MAAKDEDRKMSLITKVRNLENELHNREVLSNATGSLAVVYHEQKTLHGAYIPCQYWHSTPQLASTKVTMTAWSLWSRPVVAPCEKVVQM